MTVATVLAACTSGTADQPAPATPTVTAPAASGAAPPAPSGGAGASAVPDLAATPRAFTGIQVPWGLAFLPGGEVLVAERNSARVLRLPADGGQPQEVYRVPGVVARGEGGLLGLAVSPRYAEDRWVYAYFTSASDNRLVRFQLGGGAPEVLFDGLAKANIHNGGRIAFGPDGMLYVGTGDAGNTDLSQNARNPNGKILRLTPEGDPAPGNPTPGSPVYTLGHRNVQGLAWDGAGRMYAIEFGQNRFDEVNLIEPGRNYGWPDVEGNGNTAGGRYTNPLVTWTTDEASPSGAAVAGNTLYVAALRGQRLWTVQLRDGAAAGTRAEFQSRFGRLRTVAVAPDGALWLTTSNTDGRGGVRDGDDRVMRFPVR